MNYNTGFELHNFKVVKTLHTILIKVYFCHSGMKEEHFIVHILPQCKTLDRSCCQQMPVVWILWLLMVDITMLWSVWFQTESSVFLSTYFFYWLLVTYLEFVLLCMIICYVCFLSGFIENEKHELFMFWIVYHF